MKNYWLIGIPLAFVAGLLTVVLLQFSGLIKISGTEQSLAGVAKPVDRVTAVLSDSSIRAADDPVIEDLQAELTALQQELDFATQERGDIREQLAGLQESVLDQEIYEPFLPGQDTVTLSSSEVNGGRAGGRNRAAGFGGPDSSQQYEGLLAAGVDPFVARNIKQRSDQWALARLELLDTAEREGWRGSEEFGAKMRELRDERPDLREELGDSAYDNYLYISGENNRVRIDSIITGSAAQLSGLEQGDLVLSYANNPIFTHRQLQGATRDGSRGESVSLAVQRSGQYLSFDIPRGPLGVTLSGIRVDPAQ